MPDDLACLESLEPVACWPPSLELRDKPLPLPALILTLLRNPHEAWRRAHLEEPVVVEKVPFGAVVLVNDPEAVRRVLLDNADNYRKDSLQRRIMGAALRDSILNADGARWRAQRRSLSPIFSRKTVLGLAPAMAAATESVAARWREDGPETVQDVAADMGRLALDVLVRTIFSDGFGEEAETIRRAAASFFHSIGRIDPFDVLGLPEYLPRLFRLTARGATRTFMRALDRQIGERRASPRRPEATADLLDLLLEAQAAEGSVDDSEIRANLLAFMVAGHETTANALAWSFYLLAGSPNWTDRALDEACRAGPLDSLDDDSLPVCRAVVEESLRLFPPLSAISRQANAPDRLAGVDVEADTFVVISPFTIHRHRTLWSDPDRFDPGRFMPDRRRSIPRGAYLPFGAGPRICIGASFARLEATLALAGLLREFSFELAQKEEVRPLHRITLKPAGGLPMRVARRACRQQAPSPVSTAAFGLAAAEPG